MSHRAEDNYSHVALLPIKVGNVVGYRRGDPVPESVVEELELDESQVCRRDEWEDRPEDEPERAMARGDMPPHLRQGTSDRTPETPAGEDQGSQQDELAMPAQSDTKAAWVEYATDSRQPDDKQLTEEEAASMSKQAIMDRFKD
jgi:hypothetical protein